MESEPIESSVGTDIASPGLSSQSSKRKEKKKKGQESAKPGWDPQKGAQVQRNATPKGIQVQRNATPNGIHAIKETTDEDDIDDDGIVMKWNDDGKITTNVNSKAEERASVQAEDLLGKF